MNDHCRWPNCPRPAVTVLRIADIGDRSTCDFHVKWATEMGLAFRRLDETVVVPEWRQRSLARVFEPTR